MSSCNASPRLLVSLIVFALPSLAACGGTQEAPRSGAAPTALPKAIGDARERHLGDLRQLTFGGENAEAYWSWSGNELILQARPGGDGCDRIYRMRPDDANPSLLPVSNGKGATTCSFFLPGDGDVIFASTQMGGDACPPRPDHSKGYVWALYDTYDIYRAKSDGSGAVRLTDTKGYDAEGTVCKKDGSIVFTSTRDGDIDLYRMDADGKNVRRLTNTPGYDGGAFFNADCSKIVWRASRPKPGKELDDFRALLAQGLVRPTKLELYVANADGTEPVQITYLDAASFAPFWHPSQKRILFSSNYGDPKGREFDIWSVGIDGTGLERVTYARGFDGFPMFSPDGRRIAFSSNRATPEGHHDTNVFVARWVESGESPPAQEPARGANRIAADVGWLADDAREGRGVGTKGLEAAGAYIEQRFKDLGLEPAGDDGTFRQTFPVVIGIDVRAGTSVTIGEGAIPTEAFQPLPFSSSQTVEAPLVFAGYGIVAKDLGVDEYAKLDVKGRIVVVRRFVPDTPTFAKQDAQRRYGDLRQKAFFAREHGARGLVVVDVPERRKGAATAAKMPDEARFPALVPEGTGDAGIVAVIVSRAIGTKLIADLTKGAHPRASLRVALEAKTSNAFNVVGRLRQGRDALPGVVVVGAHYDHLGMGGRFSLDPDKHEPHNGADDNASGTAVLMEVARSLRTPPATGARARDVVFIAFSGEEEGTLGSSHFTRSPPAGLAMKDVVAMLNMDMVGRMRENSLQVLGAESSTEWNTLVPSACVEARVDCRLGGGAFGPSDHTPFYAAGAPVLHFFTGNHGDYHKPSDDADRINAAGAAQVAIVVASTARAVAARDARLSYQSSPAPLPTGDSRSFHAALGTIPDYAGPPAGTKGVLLSGVRAGGAAEKAGLRRGDILVKLGAHTIDSVEDLMFALNASRPGESVTAVALRDGQQVSMSATFEESKRH